MLHGLRRRSLEALVEISEPPPRAASPTETRANIPS
jgi:hypothetical protein